MTEEQWHLFQMMQHRIAARLTVIMSHLEVGQGGAPSSFRYHLAWTKQDDEAIAQYIGSRDKKNEG